MRKSSRPFFERGDNSMAIKPKAIPKYNGSFLKIQSIAEGKNQPKTNNILSQISGVRKRAKYTLGRICFFDIYEEAMGTPDRIGNIIFDDENKPKKKPIGAHSKEIQPNSATEIPINTQKNIPASLYISNGIIKWFYLLEP